MEIKYEIEFLLFLVEGNFKNDFGVFNLDVSILLTCYILSN